METIPEPPSTPSTSACSCTQDDELRVPFWIVLAGVGAGAFWALTGVVVGYRVARAAQGADRRQR